MKKLFELCGKPLTTFVCVAMAIAMFASPVMASANKNKTIGIKLYSVMDAMKKDPKASV